MSLILLYIYDFLFLGEFNSLFQLKIFIKMSYHNNIKLDKNTLILKQCPSYSIFYIFCHCRMDREHFSQSAPLVLP